MSVCVCVWEREREREKERERERKVRKSNRYGLHHIEIDIFTAFLLYAFFTGAWYRAALPSGSHLALFRTNAWIALLVYSANCTLRVTLGSKTSDIIYFSDAHTFLSTQFTCHFCCPLFTSRHSCTSYFWNPHLPACQRSISLFSFGMKINFFLVVYLYTILCICTCVWMFDYSCVRMNILQMLSSIVNLEDPLLPVAMCAGLIVSKANSASIRAGFAASNFSSAIALSTCQRTFQKLISMTEKASSSLSLTLSLSLSLTLSLYIYIFKEKTKDLK